MVEWCLDNGADTTIPERDVYTPMHGAEIGNLLLKAGVGLRDMNLPFKVVGVQ